MDSEKPHQVKSFPIFLHPLQLAIFGVGLISAVLYFYNFKLQPFFDKDPLITSPGLYLYGILFLILSLLYMISTYLVFKYRAALGHSKSLVALIIFFAVLFRAFLVPVEPEALSKDMYRYIWDGRIQQNGINPYQHPPDAVGLKPYRDDRVYPHINRKSYPTLYPAGAQHFFRLFYRITGDSVAGYKSLMAFFDVMTIFALLVLLRVYGFEEARLLIYAWNPMVIFEIAYSGHLEGLTVFWMVLAFLLNAINKHAPGVAALAVSSAIKLYPALLLPALLNRGRRIKGCLVFTGMMILLYLPFLSAGRKVLGFLPIYLQNPYESFNLGLKHALMQVVPQIHYSLWSIIFLLCLATAGLFVFFKDKEPIGAIRYAYILMGLLIIMMPASLHPWYVIILIPFLCFFPAIGWLLFSCLVTLSYIKYVTPTGIMPTAVLVLEYGLLWILLGGGIIIRRIRTKNRGDTRHGKQQAAYFLANL